MWKSKIPLPKKCSQLYDFLNTKNVCPVKTDGKIVEVYGEGIMNEENVRKSCQLFKEGRNVCFHLYTHITLTVGNFQTSSIQSQQLITWHSALKYMATMWRISWTPQSRQHLNPASTTVKEQWKTSWGNWVEGKSYTTEKNMKEAPENSKELLHSAHANEWMNEWMNEQ